MMDVVTMSSEEKLLKLLRKRDQKQKHSSDFKKNAETATGPSQEEAAPLPLRISWGSVDRLVGILAILLLVFIVFKYMKIKDQNLVVDATRNFADLKSDVRSLVFRKPNDFSAFKDTFESRDVFLAPWEKKEDMQNVAGEQVPELAGKYKILGIVLDQNPQAIISDIESSQTFFVSVGDEIGGAKVESIQETKVIFLYNGAKVELGQ